MDIVSSGIRSSPIYWRCSSQADVFFLPKAIGEKDERSYFPMMAVLMDHKRGIVLSYNMFTNLRHDGYKGLEILIDFIFGHNALPSKILTQNFNSYCLFKDICQQLGIELKESNRLKNVENFKREMAHYV